MMASKIPPVKSLIGVSRVRIICPSDHFVNTLKIVFGAKDCPTDANVEKIAFA